MRYANETWYVQRVDGLMLTLLTILCFFVDVIYWFQISCVILGGELDFS